MPVITIFNGAFCGEENIIRKLMETTDLRLIKDPDIVSAASGYSGIPENKIERAFSSKTSVFNRFTHERERAIAYLRLALSRMLSDDDLLINGFSVQLIPVSVTHVLRVCLISDNPPRISRAMKEMELTGKRGYQAGTQR